LREKENIGIYYFQEHNAAICSGGEGGVVARIDAAHVINNIPAWDG